MKLDLATLLVSSAMLSLALAAAVHASRPRAALLRRSYDAWSWSMLLLGAGLLGLGLRGVAGPFVSIVLANAMLAATYVMIVHAVGCFVGRPLSWRIRWGAPVAMGALMSVAPWGPDGLALRVALYSTIAVGLVALMLQRLRHAPEGLLGARLLRLVFAAHVVLLTMRAVGVLLDRPDGALSLLIGHLPVFLSNMVVNTVATIGFLLMLNEFGQRLLESQSRMDVLTDVFNRRGLMQALCDALAAGQARREPVSVLVLDLDHFKRINDRHGHAAGDRTLVAFAAALRAGVRLQDRVGRMGGEEFAVVMPSTDLAEAGRVAQRLRRVVASWPMDPPVTFSAGAACSVEADDYDRLLHLADVRMYAAKQRRDAVVTDGGLSDPAGPVGATRYSLPGLVPLRPACASATPASAAR